MIKTLIKYYFNLLIICLMCISANITGQDKKIDFSAIDVDFTTILEEISKKTGYTYRLECKKISKRQKFFVNARDISIDEILQQCLQGSNLEYKINNNEIVIFEAAEDNDKSEPLILTQTIRGRILDKESKEYLSGANIVIVSGNPQLGSSSDENGRYRITEVPLGRYSLKASFIGYNDVVIPEILVGSAKEIVLDIELSESVRDIEQIVIQADKERPLNDMALVSARSFSVEETKRYAASFSDPARMALCYAGVATTDDYLNEIIIRGNSPQYLLWRIEGIEVPSPNHFTGGGLSGGAISILSSNVTGRSDFLSGAFPADYGNALSGVFDISLRNGNNEKNETAFQAGTLGLDFSAEGPFKKNYTGSYLFNYRYSSLAFLNLIKLNFLGENAPSFQDLSFNLHLPTKRFGKFSFWGVGGASYDGTQGKTESNEWNPEGFEYREKWADYMMAVGLSHTIFTTEKSYIQSTIALTKYGSANWIDTLLNTKTYNNIFSKELYNTSHLVSVTYNNKVNKRINFRLGANLNYFSYNYYLYIAVNPDERYTLLNSKGETFISNLFMQTKIKLSDQLTLSAGLNYMYFDLNKFSSYEPRCAIQYDFKNNQSLSLGFGMHGRHELPAIYFKKYLDIDSNFNQLSLTPDLPVAQDYIFSYTKRFSKNIYFKFEAYYQRLFNYYVASDPNFTFSAANSYLDFSMPLSSKGYGRNYGVEFTLEKYFTDNYYFLLTSSLFNSEYKPLNGIWYNTIYDLGHIYNVVAGREFSTGISNNNIFGFNIKINWTGGKRDTPIKFDESVTNGFTVYDELNRNTIQYPDYFRIDLGINYRVNKKKVAHIFSLDIQNITNRKNIAYKYYDATLKTITIKTQAGMIPVINYRLEF